MSPEEAAILRQMNERLLRMDQALFGSEGSPGYMTRTDAVISNHATRITMLEFWRWLLTGAGTVLGWLIGHHLVSGDPTKLGK